MTINASQKTVIRIVLLASLTLLVFFTIQRVVISLHGKHTSNKYEQEKIAREQAQKEEYLRLIQEQEKRSQQEERNNQEVVFLKALGKHTLYIVLVRPQSVSEGQLQALVNQLNSSSGFSLSYIKQYLEQEAVKHKVTDFNLDVKSKGTYRLDDLGQIGNFAYIWGKNPFAVADLEKQFETLLYTYHVNPRPDDLVIFLYFDNSFVKNMETREGSFYEFKKFRSFANREKKRAYVNVYDFSPSFAPKLIETLTHELLHLFGASDKYIETSWEGACRENGRGEPDREPLFPQYTGDIMCLFVEYQESQFKRGSFSEKSLVINKYTAQEIGWLEEETP